MCVCERPSQLTKTHGCCPSKKERRVLHCRVPPFTYTLSCATRGGAGSGGKGIVGWWKEECRRTCCVVGGGTYVCVRDPHSSPERTVATLPKERRYTRYTPEHYEGPKVACIRIAAKGASSYGARSGCRGAHTRANRHTHAPWKGRRLWDGHDTSSHRTT